jgi:D-amino peptidase
MKIFITADLEGVSGVVHPEHTGWDGRRHHEARKWLTDDVNAAVDAAVNMGATEVLVCDGHSSARNIIISDMHPAATLMFGRSGRRLGQMEGIDASFAAVFQIGFHARVGTPSTLNHTTNSGVLIHSTINGRPIGEMEINTGIAGEFGVPVAMASGDAAAMAEIKEFCP